MSTLTKEFPKFGKVPRWSRDIVITEKIDGTNALVDIEQVTDVIDIEGFISEHSNDPYVLAISINPDLTLWVMRAGSRERWLCPKANWLALQPPGTKAPETDNYGFALWVRENAEELFELGPGTHYGEWWGKGIGRNYGLTERRFSLFNVSRWSDPEVRPACCGVVPKLFEGPNDSNDIAIILATLGENGSYAAPGFMKPEGIVIYHTAGNHLYKKLLEKDELPKGIAG